MIYNPPEIAQQRESESKDGNKTRGEKGKDILDRKGALRVAVKMERVIPVFIQQLKMLLGVSSNEWVCGLIKIPYFLEISSWHLRTLLP